MSEPKIEIVVNGDITQTRSDHAGAQGQALRNIAREIEEAHDLLDEMDGAPPSERDGQRLTLAERIDGYRWAKAGE